MKVFKAVYEKGKNKGVYAISLVEKPAMEGLFVALSEEKVQFATINEEKQILIGLVLEPNKPIYRVADNGDEFYITFDEETIQNLSYDFFVNNNQNNSTIEHTSKPIQDVTFVESWLVENPETDKSALYGFRYPKGSWVATMKVNNPDVWNDYVKTGKVKGFSIDAMLSLEEVKLNKLNMDNQILETLKQGLSEIKALFTKVEEVEVKLGSMALADGSITVEWDGEMLSVGISVWTTAEDGTKVPLPVGEYVLESGVTLVVTQEGIVDSLVEAPAETPTETEMQTVPATDDLKDIVSGIKSLLIKYSEVEEKLKGIEAKFSAIETENVQLKEQVQTLSEQPATKPIKSTPTQPVNLNKMTLKERIKYQLNN